MVRTRADAMVTRAAGAKAPRKNLGGSSTANNPDKNNKGREHTGGNSYCPRETPEWQKPITSFFNRPPESGENTERRQQQRQTLIPYANKYSQELIREEKKVEDLEAGPSTSGASTSRQDKTDY